LVVVDEEDKVTGIISLSDLLMYLVLRPTGECGGASLRNEHGSIEEKDESVEEEKCKAHKDLDRQLSNAVDEVFITKDESSPDKETADVCVAKVNKALEVGASAPDTDA
jgi:5'-AMP-activated protein kinase, regulatory gamma subunit